MNERIRLLAEQAEKLADEHTNAFTDGTGEWKLSWYEVYDEKFAELIVRECGDWIVNNAGAMEHLGPLYFAKAMEKDFGVE